MKNNAMIQIYGNIWGSFLKDKVPDKAIRKQIKEEYKAIMLRAKDIGANNNLLNSYTLAAYFIAMNRKDGLTPDENYAIVENGMKNSKLLKMALGNADSYLDEKRTAKRREWSAQTHRHVYENDWEVDILPKTDEYELGYDYTACGVCALCRDEGCFELAHYLCKADFLLTELIGLRLTRTTTLADGGDKCDFRFHRV